MVLQGYYAMGKTPIKHTLAGYIIKKTDTEGYRSGKLTGEKHLNKITEMMEFVGGRRKLIDQARFIENNICISNRSHQPLISTALQTLSILAVLLLNPQHPQSDTAPVCC